MLGLMESTALFSCQYEKGGIDFMAKTPKEPEKDSAPAVPGVDSLSEKQQHEHPEAPPFEPDTPPPEMSGEEAAV